MSTIHESTISLLLADYPGAKRTKFVRSVKSLEIIHGRRSSPAYGEDLLTFDPTILDGGEAFELTLENYNDFSEGWDFRRVPDAYYFDFDRQMAICFEVEDYSKMSLEKLGNFFDLYRDALEPIGWGLGLIVVDRWGRRQAVHFFDHLHAALKPFTPNSMLAAISVEMDIEFEYSKLACLPIREWDVGKMDETIAKARVRMQVPMSFWRDGVTRNVHAKLVGRVD